jgi:mandelate racemase
LACHVSGQPGLFGDRVKPSRLAHLGQPKPIPAYNGCGLGLIDEPEAVADEVEKLFTCGFRAIKLRLGYPTAERDLAAVRAVPKRIGDGIGLMVDYNQALSVAQAIERGRMLDAENILWLEEPIRHDNYAGSAGLAVKSKRGSDW